MRFWFTSTCWFYRRNYFILHNILWTDIYAQLLKKWSGERKTYFQSKMMQYIHIIRKCFILKHPPNAWWFPIANIIPFWSYSTLHIFAVMHNASQQKITPILKYLHWLKINETIKHKVLSLIYKSLKTGQPSYFRSLLLFPSHRCTRSSSLITLNRPSLTSRLKISNRSSTILLLFYGRICHLIYVRLFITSPLLIFQTCLCLLFDL